MSLFQGLVEASKHSSIEWKGAMGRMRMNGENLDVLNENDTQRLGSACEGWQLKIERHLEPFLSIIVISCEDDGEEDS